MTNPTLQSKDRSPQRTSTQQRRRPNPARTTRTTATFRKQTARVEGRRDGTPLIFGWGRHLTRAQKVHIQHVAGYGFFGLIIAVVLVVFLFGVLNENVLIPNATIVQVNDVHISQTSYRKLLAYNAQDIWNQIQANMKLHDQLAPKVGAGDRDAITKANAVLSQLQAESSNYAQTQVTQNTMDNLVEDQLIQQGAARISKQDPSAAKQLTPTADAIAKQFDAFKAAFPADEKFNDFLSKNNMTASDVRAAIALQMRRDLMQSYLAAHLVSPTLQVHARHIETNSKDDAQKARDQILKDKLTAVSASWSDLAKKSSLDPNSKENGGDMGWIVPGENDGAIEIWALDPSRKVGDLSPVIATSGGTFDIVQILQIDPKRPVDATALKNDQSNALTHWLSGQRMAPFNSISTPDSSAMQSKRNLPVLPNLNAQLPNFTPQLPGQGQGLPPGLGNIGG
jgi:parvulin-like peptidyl-prolyl isomerase